MNSTPPLLLKLHPTPLLLKLQWIQAKQGPPYPSYASLGFWIYKMDPTTNSYFRMTMTHVIRRWEPVDEWGNLINPTQDTDVETHSD